MNCKLFILRKNRSDRAHLSSLFSFVLEYDSKLFLMTRKLNKIVYTPKGYIKTTQL